MLLLAILAISPSPSRGPSLPVHRVCCGTHEANCHAPNEEPPPPDGRGRLRPHTATYGSGDWSVCEPNRSGIPWVIDYGIFTILCVPMNPPAWSRTR